MSPAREIVRITFVVERHASGVFGKSLVSYGWREIFVSPQYRGRTIVVLSCWLLGNAGLIHGSGAFAAVYMVDHGGAPSRISCF